MLLITVILSLFTLTHAEPADFSSLEKNDPVRQVILEKAKISLQSVFDSDQYRFTLKARWIPGRLLSISPGNILEVRPVGPVEKNTIFEVTHKQRSGNEKTQIQLSVETECRIPVAVSRIASGKILTAEDFEIRWISVSLNRGQLAESMESLEGKTLRRTLAPGQSVRLIDVTSEYLIQAGEPVTLIYEGNGIRIGIKGEARENGSEGDEIKIYSEETRKRYLGKVQSPGTAIWQQTL